MVCHVPFAKNHHKIIILCKAQYKDAKIHKKVLTECGSHLLQSHPAKKEKVYLPNKRAGKSEILLSSIILPERIRTMGYVIINLQQQKRLNVSD